MPEKIVRKVYYIRGQSGSGISNCTYELIKKHGKTFIINIYLKKNGLFKNKILVYIIYARR